MKKSKRGLWIFGFLCVMVSGIVLSNSKRRAKTVIYPTVASGEQVKESNNCVIDYSNTADGSVIDVYKRQHWKPCENGGRFGCGSTERKCLKAACEGYCFFG